MLLQQLLLHLVKPVVNTALSQGFRGFAIYSILGILDGAKCLCFILLFLGHVRGELCDCLLDYTCPKIFKLFIFPLVQSVINFVHN